MTTTKRRLIRVTQEDIDNGKPDRVTSCPVALALRRTYEPDDSELRVTVSSYIAVVRGSQYIVNSYSELPRSVAKFITRFDIEGPPAVEPFNFYVTENVYDD